MTVPALLRQQTIAHLTCQPTPRASARLRRAAPFRTACDCLHQSSPCKGSTAWPHNYPPARRRRTGSLQPCTAAKPGSVADATTRDSEESAINDTISRIQSIVATGDELIPFDKKTFNRALLIWKLIASIPAHRRVVLVDRMSPREMKQLWQLAVLRYKAKADDVLLAQGPWSSPWSDMPNEPGKEVLFAGKAAVPLSFLVGRFQKAFFVSKESYELYGRVRLWPSFLADRLYPLYFKVNPKATLVPATQELADLSLEYLPQPELGLSIQELPSTIRWPTPSMEHRQPFSGGLVDYLRPIGPGVYVGVGWKDPGGSHEKQFLYFIMAKREEQPGEQS